MSSEDFIKKHLSVGDRQVHISTSRLGGTPSVSVTYINLPVSEGDRGPKAMNNRLVFMAHFGADSVEKVSPRKEPSLMII